MTKLCHPTPFYDIWKVSKYSQLTGNFRSAQDFPPQYQWSKLRAHCSESGFLARLTVAKWFFLSWECLLVLSSKPWYLRRQEWVDALTGVKDLFPSTGSKWLLDSVHPAIAALLARCRDGCQCKHLLNGSTDLDSILLFLPISLYCCCCFLFLSPHTVQVPGLVNLFCWHVALSVFLNAGLTFFLFSPFLGSLPCWSPHTHVGSRCTMLG